MKIFVLACLFVMAFFVNADVPATQTLSASNEIQSIWPGAHYLLDEQAAFQAKDILLQPPFNPQSSKSAPNLGFITGQVWVWFKFRGAANEVTQLQVGFPHLSQLSAYVFSDSGELIHSVEDISTSPFSSQLIPSQFINILLPSVTQDITVMLKIRSDHALRLPIDIGPEQVFSQHQLAKMAIVFVSLGMLLALCIYNLILFISTSRVYYLFYCLNLVFLQVFFLIDLGFTRYLLTQSHWLNHPSAWSISVCFAFVFAILFAKTFLRLANDYPKWNRWFWLLISGVALDIILVLFHLNEVAMGVYLVVSGLYQISVIVVAVQVLRQGYQPARFFLLAWIFLAIGGFIYQLTIMGQVPVNLLTEHAFLIGSVIESLLLSWALAELISKLQSDQITSERHYQNILNKTGNRLAQALKIADKHKKVRDVFLKNISHELKTPLHSIQHVLDLALQGYQVNNELMHDANHSTRLISRHIDKLLLNTEMGVSNPDFKLEQVDIKPTLKVWHQDLYNECRVRGTQFSLNSNLVDWDILAGPVRPVYLLLTEVIFNAANLDVDSITLDFNILQDSGQLHIHFDIHDASYSPIIEAGELFQSEQDAVFINDLVALLGGHWDIEFEHPVIVADIYLPYFTVSKKKGSDHLPKQVLVVEDNEINQKVMRSMLSRMGIECEIAINGEDALNIQALRPVDIILMDCQMPVMDGFDTTVAIRSNVKRYQQPIIIAVSANSMELDKTRCLAVGMNDFIAKPVRMADLRNVLMRWEGIKPKRL